MASEATVVIIKGVRGKKPRQIATRVLKRASEGGQFVEFLLDHELSKESLAGSDRRLTQELVYGCLRWERTLDWLVAQKTAGKVQKPLLQILLRLGLYQMFWLSRIPDHASISITVELGRDFGFEKQTGFINALLRGYARERDQAQAALAELKLTNPPIGFSHPDWLFQKWAKQFTPEELVRLMEWNNTPAPVYARCNHLKITPPKLVELWEKEGLKNIEARFSWVTGDFFQIEPSTNLNEYPSFQQGLFYVQDPSTSLAVKLLDAKPEESVLDLCAAPGGKTTLIAQEMSNRGRILATDTSPERLNLISENCSRMGVTCAVLALAKLIDPSEKFKKVLLDAPCSNSGVLRRRIELRWRIEEKELVRLQKTQAELIRLAAFHVSSKGRLVYSTCSLEPEENENIIRDFLSENAQFRRHHEESLNPIANGVDGAFVAVLEKD